MGAIGVETNEREISVDEVLRENPCDHGLSDPALFAADEMNVGHDMILGRRVGGSHRTPVGESWAVWVRHTPSELRYHRPMNALATEI